MFSRRLQIACLAVASVGTVALGALATSRTGLSGEIVQAPAGAAARARPAAKPIREILHEAAHAIQSSPDPSSRVYALVEIGKAQARAGDKEGAIASARQAAAAALALDPNARCWALLAVAWARDKAGDRSRALDVLRLVKRNAEATGTEFEHVLILGFVAGSQCDLGAGCRAGDHPEHARHRLGGAQGAATVASAR